MSSKPPFDGEVVRLGELIGKAKVNRCGGRQFPVLSMTMHDGIVRQRDRFKKTIASKDTSTYKIVYPQQLVVGFPIDEGVIYVQNFDEPGIMSPAYNIWDIDTSKVLPAYLELALHSPQAMTYYAAQMKGTTARRRTLSSYKLCDIRVPLPSLGRQLQTVRLFQQVRSLLHVNEKKMAKLGLLVKSRFIEMFETRAWETVRAGDVMFHIRNGISPSRNGTYHEKVLTLSAITQGSFDAEAWKDGTFNSVPPSDKRVSAGTFFMCRGNGNKSLVGAGEYAAEDRVDLVFPDTAIAAEVDQSRLCLPYLSAVWKRPAIRAQLEAKARTTNGTFKINQGIISEIVLSVPPLDLQQQFADFVAKVDKLEFPRWLRLGNGQHRGSQIVMSPRLVSAAWLLGNIALTSA